MTDDVIEVMLEIPGGRKGMRMERLRAAIRRGYVAQQPARAALLKASKVLMRCAYRPWLVNRPEARKENMRLRTGLIEIADKISRIPAHDADQHDALISVAMKARTLALELFTED